MTSFCRIVVTILPTLWMVLVGCSSSRLGDHYSDLPNRLPDLKILAQRAIEHAEEPLVYSGEDVEILSQMLYAKLDSLGDQGFALRYEELSDSEKSALRLPIKRWVIKNDFPITSSAIAASERRNWPAIEASKRYAGTPESVTDSWRSPLGM